MLDFCHLVNILTNTNNIPKLYLCNLASILTNTNNEANNYTKKKVWMHLTDYSLLVIR